MCDLSPFRSDKHVLSCVENAPFPSSNGRASSPIRTLFPGIVTDPNHSRPVFPEQPFVEHISRCRVTTIALPVPLCTTYGLKTVTLFLSGDCCSIYHIILSRQRRKHFVRVGVNFFFFPISVSLNHVLTPVCGAFPEGPSPLSS